MFTIYGKPNCTWCTAAKATLDRKGYAYNYVNLDSPDKIAEFQSKFPEAKTVPQILWYDTPVGGYDKLEDFIKTI